MAVYVDNARIPKTVGRINGQWSHLTADTIDELNDFAGQIGLKSEWFQTCKQRCGRDGEPCLHWHYDVTAPKRLEALQAGAQPITMRRLSELLSERRSAHSAMRRQVEPTVLS